MATEPGPRWSWEARGAIAALAFVVVLAGCGDLERLQAGTCGNHALEPEAHEECDGELECRPPGAESPCRFACVVDADCPAERGYGCGVDGVCRQATGSFELAVLGQGDWAYWLGVGDLDGDGRDDLVRHDEGRVTVSYFDGGLELAASASAPASTVPPAVLDLDGDGRDDLVISTRFAAGSSGLVSLHGQADRTLAPVLNPSVPLQGTGWRGARVDAAWPPYDDEIVAVSDAAGPSTLVGLDESLASVAIPTAPATFEPNLVAGFVADRFDEGAPCELVAIASGGEDVVWIVEPCVATADPAKPYRFRQQPFDPPVVSSVALPAPSVVAWGGPSLFASDWDGDGHQDLVVLTDAGPTFDGPLVFVALGGGDGTFHDAVGVPGQASSVDADIAALVGGAGCYGDDPVVPMALGDLDGDGAVDLVARQGIYMTSAGVVCNEAGWSTVRLADFDANGALDIAGTPQQPWGLDVLSGAGDGAFTRHHVATATPIEVLEVADFDGDTVPDLFMLAVPASEQQPRALSVLFGDAFGPPGRPQPIGSMADPDPHVLTGRFVGADAPAEAVLLGYGATSAVDATLTFVVGQANRDLTAPYLLAPDAASQNDVWALASGRFAELGAAWGGTAGVAALTRDTTSAPLPSTRAWLVAERATTGLLDRPADDHGTDIGADCLTCALAAIDLDGSGRDTLVWLDYDTARALRSDGGGFTLAASAPVDISVASWLGTPAFVADVDADGREDLALIGLVQDPSPAQQLALFWNGGPLSPDGAGPAFVDGAIAVSAAAFVQADDDAPLEVAVVSRESDTVPNLHVLQVDAATRALQPLAAGATPLPAEAALQIAAVLIGLSSMVRGDFDGDGVDDLAVGGVNGYAVLRGQAVEP